MTNNHLLLYRLAELMLEKQQHILALDDLFEDDQIGAFVRSIQIDSPYQQLIFEGVLTETIKEERVMVTFTLEGYFHYVLGEVIEKQTGGKGAKALKELLENNQLRGITEGVEQCLVRDVEKNDLSRLMWLVDEGGKALEASAYPLAQAFTLIEGNPKTDEEKEEASKNQIEKVMDELLADSSDYDIEVLEKAIEKLENIQLNQTVSKVYRNIFKIVQPDNILKASLVAKSITHIPKGLRIKHLNKLSSFSINEKNKITGDFYFYLAKQFSFIEQNDKAIKYFEKSLAISLKVHGDKHPSTAFVYDRLGSVCNDLSEFDKAIEYSEKSLAINLKVHGDQHTSTGISYNNLGNIWSDNGDYNKAIECYEKSLAINLKVHGDQHPHTAVTLHNLGTVCNDKEEYNKAIEYLEKSLAIILKVYGDEHHSTGLSYYFIGSVWSKKGEYVKSIYYLEKSLAINLKVYGDQHPSTATTYRKLGSVWRSKGEYDKAIDYLENALAIYLKFYGDQHPSTGTSYNNLGLVCSKKGEYDKAIQYFEKSLAIYLKVHGDQHPYTATSYENLGLVWEKKREWNKAIEYYEKSLAIKLKVYGDQHPYIGDSFFDLACVYLEQKKFKEALDYLKKGFVIHSNLGGFPFKIAICYENLNQLEEATKNYCLSAEIRKKGLGIEDDSTQKAIQEAIRLAKDINNFKLLPDWIKKIANDQ